MGESEPGKRVLAQQISPLVPVVNLDMEGTVAVQEVQPLPAPRVKLLEDGKELFFSMAGSAINSGTYAANKPYVSASLPGVGRSLQLTLPPRTATFSGPDEVMLVANEEGDEARYGVGLNFDNPKYFGFSMYVHGSSSLPLSVPVNFLRLEQDGSTALPAPCGVPLVATLAGGSGGSVSLSVVAKDDANPGRAVVASRALSVGAWHHFVFFLHPSSNAMPNKGVLTLWIDGDLVVDSHEDWGCNVHSYFPPVQDKWRLKVGMSRGGNLAINQWMYTFFDNIRLAPSRLQADPQSVY